MDPASCAVAHVRDCYLVPAPVMGLLSHPGPGRPGGTGTLRARRYRRSNPDHVGNRHDQGAVQLARRHQAARIWTTQITWGALVPQGRCERSLC